MADLQPLLPRKIQQSVFAPIAPDLSASPEMSGAKQMPGLNPGGGGGALGVIAPSPLANIVSNPRMVANSSDRLVNRRSALEADIYKRENPVAPTTALGKIGHVAANVGNVLGNIFAPGVMSLIPGTQLGNERKVNLDQSKISDISKQQTEEAQRGLTTATTAYQNARPAIEQAKIRQHLTTSLAPKGFTISDNPAAPGGFDIVQDPDSPYTKKLNALALLQDAQAQRTQLQSENLDNKYKPGTPQYEEWNRKLQQADERLGVAMAGLGLRKEALGFHEDEFYNPQPEGLERSRGDLAQSALNQIGTMRTIIQQHPEMFGPGGAAKQSLQRWLSSNAEDAGKFKAASTYLAEHAAGALGARGEYIVKELQQITSPNFDPSALGGALDQAEGTFRHFAAAGSTHGKGQKGYAASHGIDSDNSSPAPKDGETKINSAGDKVVFKGGKWGPA